MTSSWFFLTTLSYDARSTTHQIANICFRKYRHCLWKEIIAVCLKHRKRLTYKFSPKCSTDKEIKTYSKCCPPNTNSNARIFPLIAYFRKSTANTLPSAIHSAVPCVSVPVAALPGNLQIRNILCFLSHTPQL